VWKKKAKVHGMRISGNSLMLKRRAMIAQKFISGEWGVELHGVEKAKSHDHESRKKRDKAWRKRPKPLNFESCRVRENG